MTWSRQGPSTLLNQFVRTEGLCTLSPLPQGLPGLRNWLEPEFRRAESLNYFVNVDLLGPWDVTCYKKLKKGGWEPG